MVSTGYIFSYRFYKFKQLTKNIPNVENIFCWGFFLPLYSQKTLIKDLFYLLYHLCFCLSFFFACSWSSPCSPLFLLFLPSQLWGWTSLPAFVATLSWINKSYLLFFSSTSQFLTVLFAGGSWCKSSHCAHILYSFFSGYFEIVISCMISSEELFYHTKQMWRNHSLFS